MFRQIFTAIVVFGGGLLVASCSDPVSTDSPASDVESSVSPPSKATREVSSASAELVPIPFAEWERRRATLVPNIVVVDLWATWCTPCLERFPHMVEMHHKYKGQGVEFVSLSLDDREDEASVAFARTFLKKQQAEFANYLLDENVIDGMNMIGVQTIPAVNIYDRRGDLMYELNNNDPNRQFTDKDIDYAIQDLLASE